MNSMNRLHNIRYHKVYSKNLDELLEVLSTAIDTQDRPLLIYLTNRWKCYQMNMITENDRSYIINNSNKLNYINFLIEDAKYLINIEHNKE